MIPVINIEFYPSWFLPVLPCLYNFVLCKNPVTSLYLAGVSPNFLIVFCIKSLMLDLTNYIQIHIPLCQVCLSIPADSLPTCDQRPIPPRQGTQRVCGTQQDLFEDIIRIFFFLFLSPYFSTYTHNSLSNPLLISVSYTPKNTLH